MRGREPKVPRARPIVTCGETGRVPGARRGLASPCAGRGRSRWLGRELTSPWQAVKDAGGEPVLLAPEKDPVNTVNHDAEPGGNYEPDHAVGDISAADFAGLVLPGGVGNVRVGTATLVDPAHRGRPLPRRHAPRPLK
jgi:DJ-1/PfpI family